MKIATASRSTLVLIGLGVGELVASAMAAWVIDRETTYPLYLAAYLGMGLFWLGATYVAIAHVADSPANRRIVVIVAVLARLPFLMTDPVLSDDIFRYVWDGRVQHAGINPYLYPPDDEAVAFLREGHEENYAGINNKDIPTIYPPVMQMAFYAVTAVSESLVAMKGFFVLVDVALWFVLLGLLRRAGLDRDRLLIYAWCPLPIVEIGASGHNDVLGSFFLMASLLALLAGRERLGLSSLTFSGLAKVLGFALVPLFVRHARGRALAMVPLVAIGLTLPYVSAGALALRGLREYGLRWRGNDGLFHVLYALTGSLDTAKLIVAALLVGLTLYFVARKTHPLPASYCVVGAVLLLTTTVHPWYLLWIAPFLCLYPSPAWLYLTLGIALGYHAAYLGTPGEPWQDTLWVKLVEYVPFFLLLVLARLRGPCSRKPFARF